MTRSATRAHESAAIEVHESRWPRKNRRTPRSKTSRRSVASIIDRDDELGARIEPFELADREDRKAQREELEETRAPWGVPEHERRVPAGEGRVFLHRKHRQGRGERERSRRSAEEHRDLRRGDILRRSRRNDAHDDRDHGYAEDPDRGRAEGEGPDLKLEAEDERCSGGESGSDGRRLDHEP